MDSSFDCRAKFLEEFPSTKLGAKLCKILKHLDQTEVASAFRILAVQVLFETRLEQEQ